MHALYQMVIFPMTWMDFKVTAFLSRISQKRCAIPSL